MNVDSSQNIISFCTGYGGLEMGIKRACPDIRVVCNVEIEAFAITNLVAKIEQGKMDAAPIWSNLKTFPAQIFRGKVHGIIGGYPCQPFSRAGNRAGKDDPRHLWPYLLEHIKTIRPVWVFCENVAGHFEMGFDEVYRSLADLGFTVEAGLFSASECGLSHERQRLFFLAYSNKVHLPERNRLESSKIRQPQEQYQGIRSLERKFADRRAVEPRDKVVRIAHGAKKWVDRYNLLGNGVVPQTAELAFKTLWNRI